MAKTITNFLNSWVTCPQPREDARLRLFCFPYAGGNASIYHTWANSLPTTIEVCPIQLPGRGGRFREPLFEQLRPLLPELAQALLPALSLPFVLFGHSMGALISFELARYLRKHSNLSPAALVFSGHYAPQQIKPNPHFSLLPHEEFIEAVRDYNGTPSTFFEDKELMELVLPILRADFSICETYQYVEEPPLESPIIAYGGTRDPDASVTDLLAWRRQTRKNLVIRVFSGDHFYIETARELLLQSLAEDLAYFSLGI